MSPILQLLGQFLTGNPASQKAVKKGIDAVAKEVGVNVGPQVMKALVNAGQFVGEQVTQEVAQRFVTDVLPRIAEASAVAAPIVAKAGKDALNKISEAELTRVGAEIVKNLSGEAARKVAELGLTSTEVGALAIFGMTEGARDLADKLKRKITGG